MKVKERIQQLRELMKQRHIDAYIIPSSDPHQSEYLPGYYRTREFITGFTGSAGLAIVTQNEAGLWTDGRYFVQAEAQLKGSGVTLYRMGEEKVPTYKEFLMEKVPEYGKIGMDGNCFSYGDYLELIDELKPRAIVTDVDYISNIWKEDRPELPNSSAFILGKEYVGLSAEKKLKILRYKMKEANVDYHFIGSLDDVCYLYNLRGHDIESAPVVISYALISMDKAYLFVNKNQIGESVEKYLERNGIQIESYSAIYQFLKDIPAKSTIYFDPFYTNVKIYQSINNNVRFRKGKNITTYMKAVKTETELKNFRQAFLTDSVALVKFFEWLETGVSTGLITEMSASDKLHHFRAESKQFIEESFGTISAYGENAALPHYSPSKEKPVTLKNKGFYLVDSGGHYYDGTTDITRTIALGELTEEEKMHYTYVLKSHIALATAKFKKGTSGQYLDAFSRYELWKKGWEFNHGTGHGVGFVLNVHEGPQRIAWAGNQTPMEIGMVTSNEPGMYVPGSHGIRIENIMACQQDIKNEFADFLSFETLSYIPIDTRPIILEEMTKEEIEWLNEYHRECYEKIAPLVSGAVLEYLKKATEKIG